MRRHMSRVMCLRRDARVTTRSRKSENRMVRIVKRMNDVVRSAGVVRILLVDLERNRPRFGLQAITLCSACHAKQ